MKKIIKNISIFISYFIYEYIFIFILYGLNINYYDLDIKNKVLFLSGMNFIYIVFLFFVYKGEIKKDLEDFKEKHNSYLSKYLSYYLIGILLMGLSNIILQYFTKLDMSGNEKEVRELIKILPTYMIFSSVIYAPFVEEIIFRKSIKNVIKNPYIFIIISGFLFGILHINDYKNFSEILMGIPYIIMGLDFAYIYHKTNNIFTTMTFHFCHNLILLLIQLI